MRHTATQRLYFDNAELLEFDANVLRCDEARTAVVLDQTAFYPTSGGQPHDVGALADIPVVAVTEVDDNIVHQLASPLPASAIRVSAVVNRARRRDHTQQHSGQHLLSAILQDRFGWPTVSIHIGREWCTLDLRANTVSASALADAEQMVNELVTDNLPVTISYEDAASAKALRKPSERDGLLRIVTIEGIDRNACGGTHVNTTGAIGPVFLRGTERVRDTVRVQFLCGMRAVQRARNDATLLTEAASALSATVNDLPSLVQVQRDALLASEKAGSAIRSQLDRYEAQALVELTHANSTGLRVHAHRITDAPVKSRQTFAQRFTGNTNAVYLVASVTPPALLLAATNDAGIDCAALLRETLGAVGGRGGGTPTLAQGSVPSAEAAEQCFAVILERVGGLASS